MKLHNLTPAKGSVKSRKRVGRGEGSGSGGTSTRGHKGAQSRSGYSRKRGFEGGQMPLQRRVPKFGFKNPNRVEYRVINLDTLQKISEEKGVSSFSLETLISLRLARKKELVKVLGQGTVETALEVFAHAFSASAIESIEAKGGKAVIVE